MVEKHTGQAEVRYKEINRADGGSETTRPTHRQISLPTADLVPRPSTFFVPAGQIFQRILRFTEAATANVTRHWGRFAEACSGLKIGKSQIENNNSASPSKGAIVGKTKILRCLTKEGEWLKRALKAGTNRILGDRRTPEHGQDESAELIRIAVYFEKVIS